MSSENNEWNFSSNLPVGTELNQVTVKDEERIVEIQIKTLSSESDEHSEFYESQKELQNLGNAQLTVENLQRHEKETDPFAKEDLILKHHSEKSCEEITEYEKQELFTSSPPQLSYPRIELPQISVDPTMIEITRGYKYTGEQYEAISIDIQTEESWLMMQSRTDQDHYQPLLFTPNQLSKPSTPNSQLRMVEPHDDGCLRTPEAEILDAAKNLTSDFSASDFIDSGEEEKLFSPRVISRLSKRRPSGSGLSEDDNPVLELNVEDPVFASDEESFNDNKVMTVHPPFILQYRRESEEPQVDYNNLEAPVTSSATILDEMSEEQQEHFRRVIEEDRDLRRRRKQESTQLININPHDAFSSKQQKKEEKERAAAKSKAKEIEKKKQMETQTANQANFYSFARQLKTINYSLSSAKCMEEGWTVRPKTPEPPLEPAKEFFIQELGADILSGKRYKRSFVQKHYDNGNLFLSVFPDGSGTVWYPSGNIAISIVATEKQGKLIFIVQEDKDPEENPRIQAVFEPDGKCTCYYPSGAIRTNLSPYGGEYYSLRGERMKRWQWRDKETHVHAPPFQPVTFGLSKQVGVRIIAQESIYVTFTGGKRSVRFNVGTKLRIKSGFPTKEDMVDLNSLLLQDRIVYVQSLLQRFYYTFQFPHSPRRAQIKLPKYLNGRMEKITKLRSSIEKLPPIKESMTLSSSKLHSKEPILLPSIPSAAKVKKLKHRFVEEASDKRSQNQFAVTVN